MNRKLITLLIAAVLTMALCLSAAAEAASWMPEWDMDADVVVVGFGPAGAMAAKSAMENGASVLVVEKENKEFAGGSAPASYGFIKPYTADEIYASAAGRLTKENAQRIYDKENECLAWMTENGLEMNGMTSVGFGVGFYQTMVAGMEKLGTNVLYETPAKKIISDPVTKEVYGIQCENAAGEKVYIKANKGVILCTGGYLANKDLMNRFHFAEMPDFATIGAPNQTGDGLLMAMEAGAGIDGVSEQQIEWYGYSYKKASDEMGTGILHTVGAMSPDARIFVNAKGERFMNEELYICHSKFQMPFLEYDGTFPTYNGYANLPMYVIFDSTMFNADAVGPTGPGCGYASNYGVYNWSADNMAELERGWLVKGDTIEELVANLAEQSGNEMIDAEALKNTIATYNSYCEAGEDPEFGRESIFLNPVAEGPFYAAQIVPTAVYTIGGLQGGENGETLDWQGNPIPRLYHAGDIGQPTKYLISALQGCMALGDIAGEACAQLESH